jgi:hypothetical protein
VAARAGMATLILELRSLCNAAVGDYTVNAVSYFTDDQLQAELDAQVEIWSREQLDQQPEYLNSTTLYKQFMIPDYIPHWFEEDGAGTGGWAVKDAQGVVKVINTDYTVNYRSGVIVFAVDQKGARNWLDCRAYHLYQAAASVWRQKAGLEARSVDWSNAGLSFKASQRRDYCLAMANEMERREGITLSTMYRSDEARGSFGPFRADLPWGY